MTDPVRANPQRPSCDTTLSQWVLDFTVLGGGIGLLAPLATLVMLSGRSVDVLFIALPVMVLGALMGPPVALVMNRLTQLAVDREVWLFALGFPVGMLAGGAVGGTIGRLLDRDLLLLVGGMGAVTGGMALGLVWLPYLALKLQGRSGLPVMLGAAFFSPLAGAIALFGVLTFF